MAQSIQNGGGIVPQERLVFMRKASGLVRELNMTDVIIWSIASPTASGLLYYQVANAAAYPGANPILAFLIGGIVIFPLVYTLATMMRIMPRSGGMYVCISRLLDPSVAFVTNAIYAISFGMTVGIMTWVGTSTLAACMTLAGQATHTAALVSAGEWVEAMTGHIIVAIGITLLFWWASLVSLKAVKILMRWSFWLALAATVVLLIPGVFTSDASAAFNATWGPGVYEKIIEAAKANGWAPAPFSWSSTVGLLLIVFWAYSAFEYMATMAGEVKSPQKSMFGGMIGGFLCTVVLYMIVAYVVWHPFKLDFIPAYAYLYDNHPEVLGTIVPVTRPSVPFLLGSLLPNPWLAIAAMILCSLWFYNTALPSLACGARIVFAMSFDRQLPKIFATVNKRGVPTWASHVMIIIGILTIFINVYGITALICLADVGGYFAFWAFGLSAVMLPYKRPDIYNLSPVKGTFLGVPTISWLGALTTGIGWFLLAFVFGADASLPVQIITGVAVLVCIILYVYALQRNVKEDVNIQAIYSEIPPE